MSSKDGGKHHSPRHRYHWQFAIKVDAMKRKRKPVEYRDTFSFRVFPDFKYTPHQEKRLRLFQGRIGHWRKIINYANNFDCPHEINLVYMIGYSNKLKPYLEKLHTNIVVLCADIPQELLDAYDRFWKMYEELKSSGAVNEDGTFSEAYNRSHDGFLKQVEYDDSISDIAAEYRLRDQCQQEYRKAVPKILKCFKRFIIVDKLHPEKTISCNDLDKIIKRYYPYGREQCQISGVACKSVKKLNEAISAGFKHEDGTKLLGMPNTKKVQDILQKSIKRCVMDINVALRNCGHVDLFALYKKMQNPPYGWGCEAHAAYCFSYALGYYAENHWIDDSVTSFTVSETGPAFVRMALTGLTVRFRNNRTVVLFNDDGWRLSNRFALMFGVEPITPFPLMTQTVRKSIEGHTRFPVSIIDPFLYDILDGDKPIYDREFANRAIKYFNWDKCRYIKSRYEHFNESMYAQLHGQYPLLTDHDIRISCTTACSGWLWNPATFYETVETINRCKTENCCTCRHFIPKLEPKKHEHWLTGQINGYCLKPAPYDPEKLDRFPVYNPLTPYHCTAFEKREVRSIENEN